MLITAVIGASVGSTAAVFLLAIVVVLIIIAIMAVLKPKKKGKVVYNDFSIPCKWTTGVIRIIIYFYSSGHRGSTILCSKS